MNAFGTVQDMSDTTHRSLRALLVTGDRPRHLFVAGTLASAVPGLGIIIERHEAEEWGEHSTQSASDLFRNHFIEFARTEKSEFGAEIGSLRSTINERTLGILSRKTINDKQNQKIIDKYDADLIFTYSTSIIGVEIIKDSGHKMINLHSGLSPYYRGSGTNVFPIIENRIEYIGMTAHYISNGIDAGPIILQGRPDVSQRDDSHTLGCACVRNGAVLLSRIAEHTAMHGLPAGIPQDLTLGRQYLKREFDNDAIERLYRAIKDGVISRYAERNPVAVDIVTELVSCQL